MSSKPLFCKEYGAKIEQAAEVLTHRDGSNQMMIVEGSNMALHQIPPHDLLSQILSYDAVTGKFFWKWRPESMFDVGSNPLRMWKVWNARYAGKEAAAYLGPSGYRCICIFDRRYPAHRIAWALYYGGDVPDMIDHINRVRCDNRISNLRPCTAAENAKNSSLRSDNKTGISGVWDKHPKAHGSRWKVVMASDGRISHTKSFKCLGAAIKHRNSKYRELGFSDGHGTWKPIGAVAAALALATEKRAGAK